jgi:uncharacterized protein (DUF2147 family)
MLFNRGPVSRRITACALALLLATPLAAPIASASGTGSKKSKPTSTGEGAIVGEWWTETKEGRIRFVRHRDGTYMGILTWSKNPRPDTENDNPKLRKRSVVGIVLIWELHYEDGEYEDGYVYNPEDGNVYRIDVKVLSRDELEVRGYLGLSLFGETQVWTRYR